MLTTGLTAIDAAAAGPALPGKQKLTKVTGEPVKGKPAPGPAESQTKAWKGAPKIAWPAAGSAEITLPNTPSAPAPALKSASAGAFALPAREAGVAGQPVKAGKLPVSVASADLTKSPAAARRSAAGAPAADAPADDVKVKVDLHDKATAERAGLTSSLLLSVERTDTGGSAAPVSVELDYAAFKNAYGGSWGSRLRFTAIPTCALTTPKRPECQGSTPVTTTNNAETGKLVATFDAPAKPAPAPKPASRSFLNAPAAGPVAAPATGGGMTLAASPGADGANGTYKATSLSASGSWQAGGSAGDFSWSYPLDIPASLGGPSPSLSLGYSSANIDGRTSASAQQSSWVGDGWDLASNYIERGYVPCSQDKRAGSGFNNPKDDTGDLCHGAPMVTMSLNGGSTQLVLDDATKKWRPAKDDGSKIELLQDAQNGDKEGDHWRFTNPQGIQFYFGLNKLPGWTPGKLVTNSAWNVPVYGNHPGEPCYKATFADAVCDQTYRWNLDYVVDPRGNAMTYWYEKEVNHYGSNYKIAGGSTARAYDRSGWLDHISYGLRGDNLFANAPAEVKFKVDERCITTKTFVCSPEKLKPEVAWEIAKEWPDTPGDQLCAAGEECKGRFTPTFFSRKRLTEVTTSVWNGTARKPVDLWALQQTFPPTGDGTDYPLWLAEIKHFGKNGAALDLPAVKFRGKQLPNRVDGLGDGKPAYLRYRIEAIDTESGSTIQANYKDTQCRAADPRVMPASPESNTLRCYPVVSELPDPTDPAHERKIYFTDWFHKHVVDWVQEDDRNGNSPSRRTEYEFVGNPAWAFDDETEMMRPKTRTWSQWRGYERVKTFIGQAPDKRSMTETLFFRGLDGDRATPAGGTRSVKVKDSEGNEIADHRLYAGQTREVLAYNGEGGALEAATTYTPWLHGPTATRLRKGETTAEDIEPQQSFVQQTTGVNSRILLSDGRGWRRTAMKTEYDTRGFAQWVSNMGDVADPSDDSCSRYWYDADETRWIIARQKRVETVAKACDATGVQKPADVTSDIRMSYDAAGNVQSTESLTGYSGGNPVYQVDGSATFDAYGRPKTSTDVFGKTTKLDYTPAAGQIVTKVVSTNSEGHTQTTETDQGRGSILAKQDTNGRRQVMEYDSLGRLAKVWSPSRNPQNKSPNGMFSYDVRTDGPVVITNKALLDDGTYRTSYDIYDSSLRIRQTQMEALGGGRVISDTFYNSLGQVWKSNGAYYTAGTASGVQFAPKDNEVPSSTMTQYDGSGRSIAQISRKFGEETSRTTTAYGGDNITVDPPKGETPTRAFLDGAGRKTELRFFKSDSPTGAYDKTTYAYNQRGALESVVNQAGDKWGFEYDIRGRQTKQTDPDKGTSTMTYGQGDRLATMSDARGKVIAPAYDALGRTVAMHEGSVTGPKLTSTTYDTLPGAIGLPVASTRYVDGKAYTQEVTGYDTEYRPTGTKITIPSSEGALGGTYAFSTGYRENTGLTEWMEQPAVAGLPIELTEMQYNHFELPTMMGIEGQTFVDKVDYSPMGDVLRTYTGPALSQVYTTNYYDEQTRRLTRTVNSREKSPGAINDTSYSYDAVGNILKVTDKEGPTATADVQCFAYDYLRRMNEAWTATDDCAAQPNASGPGAKPKVGGPNPYWSSYSFDAAGNRTKDVQHSPAGDLTKDVTRSYTYGTPGQAAANGLKKVDTTGPGGSRTESYTYDAAGNTKTRTIQGDTQTLDWNGSGQLEKVTKGTDSTSFVYDAGGNRLIKRDKTGSTLYLPGTEVKLTAAGKLEGTRYYAHPAGPTMVKTVKDGVTSTSYLMGDQNGTATTAVDTKTSAITRRKFTPYGEARGSAPSVWPGKKGFIGGEVDETIGTVHLGAREYDPTTGRFLSVDPIVDFNEPKQQNPYVYANNSPVTFSDPSGLSIAPPTMPIKDFTDAEAAWANMIQGKSALDIALEIAMGILKDASGYNDIRDCLGGSWGACAGLALDAALPFAGRAKRIIKALDRAWEAFNSWSQKLSLARDILRRVEQYQQAMAKYAEDLAEWKRQIEEAAERARKLEEEAAAARRVAQEAAAAAAKKADEAKATAARQGKSSATKSKKADGGGKVSKSSEARKGDAPKKSGSKDSDRGSSETGETCNSFVPGTNVLMADGSAKPIEDVKIGDEVVATEAETGKTQTETVTAEIRGQGFKSLVKITVDVDGDPKTADDLLTATDGHPFWVTDLNAWVKAMDLRPGQWLRTSAGAFVQVKAVERRWALSATVYNLTVSDLHTYYVLAGATPVLVHNCGGGTKTGSPAFDDPYHPDVVQDRIDAGRKAWAGIPREVHNTVNGIESGRVTQRINSNGPDWFNANGNTNSPWHNATIFTGVGSPTTLTRVLVRSDGGVGYVLGHNYNNVIEYGYARLPGQYVPRP
ncbi:polymorphic toxin-type HINT domain-containing protein [Streptomyces antarcticus]|uniref:polymorphic toxin-type HINT domain-containing protein n=1 Tax=Streptomyces antarcticus TaxID=2996458 RepID=UPI00226D5738|nr:MULTISPECIES: polymorphic toxin-type HINT domain-containing protein [unclassified Streptomyces]MCY0944083.1 polymorphic toxin-type HINT domain-containing protein [Streptomyces sp. H34-AA3]MCZ4082217.1 polymorphic toxin-type HINT domain-containing protein [Streptomyces sp. H34-S5]